ncbi:MAG: hypothetical protein SF066_18145 [Thermoanaerobaculia bacterium]|nr:hypothetical protein [Thermoanaerobaculia bacterium]
MDPRAEPFLLKSPAELPSVLVRAMGRALRHGDMRLVEVEAGLAVALASEQPWLRAVAEMFLVSLYHRAEFGRKSVRNPFPGLLSDPLTESEDEAPASRRKAPVTTEESDARARALVAKLPTGRFRRLEAVNLRPTLYRGAAVARVFLEHALAALPGDPRASADWAELAELAVGHSGNGLPRGEGFAELQALSYRAELYKANAQRVLGNLVEAEKLLTGAIVGARTTTIKDLRFWAESKAFRTSLRRDQRRFEEAIREAVLASALWRHLQDERWQVVQLYQLASIHEQVGDHPSALATFREALAARMAVPDDRLRVGLRHGEVICAARVGRPGEALRLFEALLPEYDRHPEHRARQHWALGLIRAGLGDGSAAEAAFRASRDAFLADGAAYDAALVTLDWTLLLLDENRADEVLPLAVSMGQAFESLGIARETLAAWNVFSTAAAQRELTRRAAEQLGREIATGGRGAAG